MYIYFYILCIKCTNNFVIYRIFYHKIVSTAVKSIQKIGMRKKMSLITVLVFLKVGVGALSSKL